MRAVVQRVTEASVSVDENVVGSIQRGLVVLLGVEEGDGAKDVQYIANKTVGLRVFEDEKGLMNLDVHSVGAQVLAISQFTLLGDVRKGKRPSFISAAKPEPANELYEQYCAELRMQGLKVEQGVFQADMQVSLVNDGPVTIMLDSKKLF
ncbi:MAG: D-aminoacyl-tRNA deacylase [Planctomycetota bacterium]|nr:D-aminoacyl-tRNA deacylase [Planctomycetota bacterium]